MADDTNTQEPTPAPAPAPEQQAPAIDYDKLSSIIQGATARKEDAVLKGYLEQQGLTGEELSQAISDFKAAREASKPDVDGMTAQINELTRSLNVAKVENAVIVQAQRMGIDAKAIPYLTRMADLRDVGTDGEIDPEKVNAALQKVLDDLPALKPTSQQPEQVGGFRIGGNGTQKDPKPDQSELYKMFGVKPKK
jgi:hypothetical protein